MPGFNPEVFIIFQHSNGIGHFTRCSALAEALSSVAHVTLFSGGKPVKEYSPPSNVDLVQLPATYWKMTPNASPAPADPRYTLHEVERMRSDLLVEHYVRVRPQVVIIDYFPFSPQRFGKTLDGLLTTINRVQNRPIVICSIRASPAAKLWDAEVDAAWVNKQLRENFTCVFHHADAELFPLNSLGSYTTAALSGVTVWQTGFIRRPMTSVGSDSPSKGLLLTVGGGGGAGAAFLKRWIKAARAGSAELFPLTAVCGPLMDTDDRKTIHAESDSKIFVLDWVEDMDALISASRAVVCLGGYNTLVEALSLRKPVLAFPNSDLGDQIFCVNALHTQGMLLKGDHSLSTADITALMNKAMHLRPRHDIDYSGAGRSVEIVKDLLAR